MTLKNLMIGSLLLLIAGCGCNDDSFPPGTNPQLITSVLGVQFNGPRFTVLSNAPMVVPIDVVFLLDDSVRFNTDTLGVVPDQPLDRRPRTLAAQRIFDNLRAQVEARLDAAIDAIPAAELPVGFDKAAFKNQLDFAFAVARYEDFGGPFTRTDTAQPIAQVQNDADARPFILNMPLLRVLHPQFATAFPAALARTAPGDGNIGTSTKNKDPQTGIEALFQIARGTGFDGNGLGGTNESGGPGGDTAQTEPGASGDVPAIRYGPAGQDPQDPSRPLYPVQDENGQPVTFNGQPVVASGNLGGVGWRSNSARFVILAGDIATVAPTNQAGFVSQTTRGGLAPLPQALKVNSTAGGPAPDGAPRAAVGIPLTGFDADRPVDRPRIGPAEATKEGLNVGVLGGYAGVAPLGAHTVEETVAALNEMGIEVLALAAPDQIPGHTKPSLGGTGDVNGDDLDITKAITDVNVFKPTFTPWTWLTGLARLTGAVDPVKRTQKDYLKIQADNDANWLADPVFDPDPVTGAPHLALVYNLANVWPYDPTAPNKATGNEATITPAVVDDLVKRLAEWIKGGYLSASAAAPLKPTLPTPVYEFGLELIYPEDTQLTHTPTGSTTTEAGLVTEAFPLTEAQIPVAYQGDALPSVPRIDLFPDGGLTFLPLTETLPTPWSEQIRFRITGRLKRIEGQTAENAAQVQSIKDQAKARGDGFVFECPLEPGYFTTTPLAVETDTVTFSQGVLEVIVRNSTTPGPTASIVLMETGQVIVNDLTLGGVPGDQVGGSNLFEDWPPAPDFGCDTEAPAVVCPSDDLGGGPATRYGMTFPVGNADLKAAVSATDNRYSGPDLVWEFRRVVGGAIIPDPAAFPVALDDEVEVEVTVRDKAGNAGICTFWVYGPHTI